MYNFDEVIDRHNTGSVKWDGQEEFGVESGLLPFWIADTDFATLPEITKAIQARCTHPIFGYSQAPNSYYEAIAGWWSRRHGWHPEKEWMLPTGGVVTAIRFTLDALLTAGDKVLIFTPVYDRFFTVIRNSGCTQVECPLLHTENTYRIDFAALERALAGGVKAVLFCNPHNPVARVWTQEELEQLTRLCAQYGVYLLSDEIHADFGLGGHSYCTAGRFPEIYDRLVIFTAISKTFNVAGLVSSCTIIPNERLRSKVEQCLKASWVLGTNELSFVAAEAAYTYGDRWVDEQCAYLTANAALVKEFCRRALPKVGVTEQEGTFLMWLDMTCTGKTSGEITDSLAKNYGIALGSGIHYGPQADGFMRLNIGCPEATLREGLKRLAAFYGDCMG